MKFHFDLLKVTRTNIEGVIKSFSFDQLNYVPEGFNNNLIWNFGHVVVTQQLLTYGMSGMHMDIDKDLVKKYRKGTRPESPIDEGEIDHLFQISNRLIAQTEEDYNHKKFEGYKHYPTSYGIELASIENGIIFNNAHEAMHLGNILSMKKLVNLKSRK